MPDGSRVKILQGYRGKSDQNIQNVIATNVTATTWQVLTNIVVGPVNQPVSYIDRSATNAQRYYRVRVTPPPL
mgnify:CR=1 FL=1